VAIAYQHVRENPIPPSRLDPSLPPWADSIVLKAMAKSPNDRYQSAAEMQADIQRAASGMQVAASMQPPTRIDYYEQQRTQQMGQQTMMGVAPTTVSGYQQTGYQTGYQQPYGYGNGGQDGGGQDQRRGSRRWIPWVISGLVVLAAIIVAVIMLNNGGSGGTANVPLVNGESYAQAATQIKAAGLNPVRNNESSSVKAGLVISTNPDNGNSVAKNSNVTVNVSTGPANIALPNLQGQQSSAAQAQLKNAGFSNVSVVSDSQSTLPSNEVDHQSPAPGSYPPNQAITLYVSGGGIKVPSVTNDTAAEAIATLTGLGFTNVHTVSTSAPASQMVEPGTVYNQTPASGQVVPSSALIQIFVQPQNATSTPTPTDSGTPTSTSTPTGTPTDGGTPTTTPTGGGLGGL
jgi:serine/threonine-protein kinase